MSVPTTGGGAGGGAGDGAVQATFAATLADEWVRCGVTDAVVCPGSRSTPLALALAARPELRAHVRLDERGAGFFAVGLGLTTGRPAVVCTTSGTAAAELHPAVVEAHHAGVPLIVCTADRPPELHGIGAPQTIDQTELFGGAVRWFCQPGVPEAATSGTWRSLAARSTADASGSAGRPGPVHLNLAFADPLVGEPGPLPPPGPPPAGPPLRAVPDVGRVAGWPGRRGLLVAGGGCGPAPDVLALAERLGWPVLADPRSGCRVTHPRVVAAADALARLPEVRRSLLPEVIVVLGGSWASKSLAEFLAETVRAGAEVVAADPWWRWVDPSQPVVADDTASAEWLAAALVALGQGAARDDPGWLGRWASAESAAQGAIDDTLAGGALSEPAVARGLLGWLPADAWVVAASSMPVRDLEWYAPPLGRPPRVLSNRGANGIDGVLSTAQGVAAAGLGPAVGVVGDLAFLHDVSSLVRPAGRPPATSCTLVVVDNGGGGIFNFLPQAGALGPERFEQLFGTPQAPDVAAVAGGFGLAVADVGTPGELEGALRSAVGTSALSVIRVRVPDRVANVALHDRIHAAVAAAVAGG
jgi:2-succinyl-5-enolpyruvyl-6-hydroxy-3-cyclohexene-1-carboxylate synthase